MGSRHVPKDAFLPGRPEERPALMVAVSENRLDSTHQLRESAERPASAMPGGRFAENSWRLGPDDQRAEYSRDGTEAGISLTRNVTAWKAPR